MIDAILNKLLEQSNFKLTENEVAQGIVTPQDSVIESHLKNSHILLFGEGIFVLRNEEKKAIPIYQK